MRQKIQLAMKACNPQSPSPVGNSLKFQGGKLVAYGGTFCVQIPCDVDAECVFAPTSLLTFFRKDRTGVTYTVNKNKLVVRHKRERVTISCMDNSEMPIIDVLVPETPIKKFLPKKALKAMLDCIDPAHTTANFQGMFLCRGVAVATTGKVILAMSVGIPKGIDCVLPVDTLKFIAGLDESPKGVGYENNLIKFYFPSGMTVCSRTISVEGNTDILKQINPIIKAEGDDVVLHKDLVEEMRGIKCEFITVSNKGIKYRTDSGKSEGEVELDSKGEFEFSVNKRLFDLMLDLTLENTLRITKYPRAVHANGKKFFKMTLAQTIEVS